MTRTPPATATRFIPYAHKSTQTSTTTTAETQTPVAWFEQPNLDSKSLWASDTPPSYKEVAGSNLDSAGAQKEPTSSSHFWQQEKGPIFGQSPYDFWSRYGVGGNPFRIDVAWGLKGRDPEYYFTCRGPSPNLYNAELDCDRFTLKSRELAIQWCVQVLVKHKEKTKHKCACDIAHLTGRRAFTSAPVRRVIDDSIVVPSEAPALCDMWTGIWPFMCGHILNSKCYCGCVGTFASKKDD